MGTQTMGSGHILGACRGAEAAAPPAGSSIIFEVTIRKPLGLVLVEGPAGTVVVEEVRLHG